MLIVTDACIDSLARKANMHKWKVKSFSRDMEHEVTQWDNGDWSCTCEYAVYKNRICDHIRRLRHLKMKWHGRKKRKK